MIEIGRNQFHKEVQQYRLSTQQAEYAENYKINIKKRKRGRRGDKEEEEGEKMEEEE